MQAVVECRIDVADASVFGFGGPIVVVIAAKAALLDVVAR